MAQRKLQQEVDRCFKKVAEGIQAFEGIFEKITQTTNPSQKEKLEDSLKREIKKLQRQRDMIKAWAASNEIKDKKPLMENRKAIETQMERFKAVEKEMKTKAYSKEGLLASTKLDPKEKEKAEIREFLCDCVSKLEQQIEMCEAESESIMATFRKGKRDAHKADRVSEIERQVERHKWHIIKLELIMRLLENGNLEVEKVSDLREDIKYYVDSNSDPDFLEDESIYDDLNLDEEGAEEAFGIGFDDRLSSQDTQSIQDDMSEVRPKGDLTSNPVAQRRPSTQLKSPMPAPATLHTPTTPAMATATIATSSTSSKPTPAPATPAGQPQPLKYASAAATGAALDRNGAGILPLPFPPGIPSNANGMSSPSLPPANAPKEPSSQKNTPLTQAAVPDMSAHRSASSSMPPTPILDKVDKLAQSYNSTPSPRTQPAVPASIPEQPTQASSTRPSAAPSETHTNPPPGLESSAGIAPPPNLPHPSQMQQLQNLARLSSPGVYQSNGVSTPQTEPIYHLPECLRDLELDYERTKQRIMAPPAPSYGRLFNLSLATAPAATDAEKPKHYKPITRYNTSSYYPQEVLPIFDDPDLYAKLDPDVLFYVFYYRQGTYAQLLAAKELKRQSWRFHKLYHTWFQRHEEPKHISEEYEQGTYRFFDFESTWMNRRKTDFQFVYKYLEDELL